MDNNAKKHLDKAVYWLNMIPVKAELVDIMAMVRQELRELDSLLQKENKNTEE